MFLLVPIRLIQMLGFVRPGVVSCKTTIRRRSLSVGLSVSAGQIRRRKSSVHAVVARSLVKRYGPFEAVRGIDFAAEEQTCFGFLGPNGAGKTTTMRMISCVAPPSGGTLEVLGLPVVAHAREI